MVDKKRLVESFMELVKIDSISGEEKNLADFLVEKLKELGLEVRVDRAGEKAESDSGNVIAYLRGDVKKAIPILFSAHMDTVVPGKNIKPKFDGNKITSSGDTILGADDKAAIAAILEALQVIKENNISHGDIEIVFSICEEIGLLGAKNLDISGLKARMAFVLDSGGQVGEIINEAPYHNGIKIVVYGKAAHAGINPEEGISAIKVAGVALSRMALGRLEEDTTANIGVISGGKASNIVPDEVILEGELRSKNEEKLEKHTSELKRVVENTVQEFNARVEVKVEREYYGYHLSADSEVIKTAIKAAEEIGLKPALVPSGGGSDANVFNRLGFPTANLAIGMEKVHTVEEYILVDSLIKSAEYILSIIKTAASV